MFSWIKRMFGADENTHTFNLPSFITGNLSTEEKNMLDNYKAEVKKFHPLTQAIIKDLANNSKYFFYLNELLLLEIGRTIDNYIIPAAFNKTLEDIIDEE